MNLVPAVSAHLLIVPYVRVPKRLRVACLEHTPVECYCGDFFFPCDLLFSSTLILEAALL